MKHNPAVYRSVCNSLNTLFKTHGDSVATCVNRYMRIRTETQQKENRIKELEDELGNLKKVDNLSRKKKA